MRVTLWLYGLLLVVSVVTTGCKQPILSTMLPSMFGDDAVFGETVREQREVVYGHVAISLPMTFSNLGILQVKWKPAVRNVPEPQYLETTFYEHDGVYYLTQWTRLETDLVYFEPLNGAKTEEWGTEWQKQEFIISSDTANHEFTQYLTYLKDNGKTLPEAFTATIYAKRFSGRIMIRVIKLEPANGGGGNVPLFQALYPLVPYKTVELTDQ